MGSNPIGGMDVCLLSVVCCKVEISATDWSLVQKSPTDCGVSLCVTKKPRTRGGYSPARGLQNTNPQWVVAPVEKKKKTNDNGTQVTMSQKCYRHIEATPKVCFPADLSSMSIAIGETVNLRTYRILFIHVLWKYPFFKHNPYLKSSMIASEFSTWRGTDTRNYLSFGNEKSFCNQNIRK